MKRSRLVLIVIGLLILVLFFVFRAPSIPHPIDGNKECLTCHSAKAIKPYPGWHATREYKNNDCLSCHHVKSGVK